MTLNEPLPSHSGPAGAKSRGAATLIDDLLAEQRQLTAVEAFSRAHDANEIRTRRYRDLLPAAAPAPGQQYAFEVDLDKCSGCKACVTACHSLNGLDDDETWRSTGALVSTDWRAPLKQTVTTACHHCVDPGCLNGCPVLAYDKDPVTGIVRHLDDQCIGCQYCVMKCPYEVPQYRPARGIVRKCDLCSSRLAVGEAPACVQACPNEAIRITLTDRAKVRGKYRQLSDPAGVAGGKVGKWESEMTRAFTHFLTFPPAHFQTTDSKPTKNDFLPDSPNPAITLPATRYVSQRPLASALEAEDAREVSPGKAHPPLTFMLVLSQLGAGLAVMGALAGGVSRSGALVALVVTMASVIVGTLHLGQPLKAWRSFLGWRRSWLSRELIAFAAFTVALGAHAAMLRPLSGFLAALTGLAAVACSAMVYVDTRRPFWNGSMTFGKFFGTMLLLGTVGAFAAGFTSLPSAVFVAIAAGSAAFKLAVENRILRFVVDEQHPRLSPLNKTALLLTGRFGLASRCRIALGVAGGILLPGLALLNAPAPTLAAAAFALCVAGELIERHLFFVAEVAPKMPGGGVA
jgi:Fe-S-cluster-containing dehydrogenase component/DMSO reductase anchor subunit